MRPTPHPNHNTKLKHPGYPDGSRDLLVEQVRIDDPEADEPSKGLVSAWQPDEDELRALANGAPVLLTVVGSHPPVMLDVGEPAEDCTPTYLASHVERALGGLWAQLRDHKVGENVMGEDLTIGDDMPDQDTFLRYWKLALQETIQPPNDGPSITDIIIPDAPPPDLGNDHLRKD